MKPKQVVITSCALFCGLFAAVVAQGYLKKDPVELMTVLVANRDVPAGTVLKTEGQLQELFRAESRPRRDVTGVVRRPAESVDALRPLLKDHAIAQMVKQDEVLSMDAVVERSQLSIVKTIRPGFRAFTIRAAADSSGGGWVQPGHWVDVISVRRTAADERLSRVLMRNIRVAAVNDTSERGERETLVPSTITLEVTEKEAKTLRKAQDESVLSLALIPQGDVDQMAAEDRYLPAHRRGEDEAPAAVGLDQMLGAGFVAYAVEVTADSAASGFIRPNHYVKVFGQRRAGDQTESVLLLKAVRVLTVDAQTRMTNGEEMAVVARTINLEVTDAEVKKLTQARQLGRLTLSLMSSKDLAGKTAKDLTDREGEPMPVPPPAVVPLKDEEVTILDGTGERHFKRDRKIQLLKTVTPVTP